MNQKLRSALRPAFMGQGDRTVDTIGKLATPLPRERQVIGISSRRRNSTQGERRQRQSRQKMVLRGVTRFFRNWLL